MLKFFIEPGYKVKHPQREYGNAGVDFFIPEYTEAFERAFEEKNGNGFAKLVDTSEGWQIVIPAHRDVNIPTGIRCRIPANVALEAHNKSGVAAKKKLIFGASTVDASYQGIIHCHLINTSPQVQVVNLGEKIIQFIPRVINVSPVEIFDGTYEEFYKDFEFTNRKDGAFGSTGTK